MNGDTYRTQIASELFGTGPLSLGSYFVVYDNLIARNEAHALQIEEPEPEHTKPVTHADILLAAEILRGDPTLTLNQASEELGARLDTVCSPRQLTLTILTSVRAMLMLNCTAPGDGWQPAERFVDFASRCFPKTTPVSAAVKQAMGDRKTMKAWKLRARCNLSLRGTDNFANHLLLDPIHPDGPTLYLFHYAAFIKAQLDRLKRENFDKEADIGACLARHVIIIITLPEISLLRIVPSDRQQRLPTTTSPRRNAPLHPSHPLPLRRPQVQPHSREAHHQARFRRGMCPG
jgi:hypothetical protein